ncbi:hypothetical protein RYX36_031679 [Vicia faba]
MFKAENYTIPDAMLKFAKENGVSVRGHTILKVKEIQRFQGIDGISLAIGVQGHFSNGMPNIAYMMSSLDLLATTGLPIWLTEVSVDPSPEQT